MNNEEIRMIIGMMTWSFSRLNSFHGCKREWFEKYVEDPLDNLDSCYGQGGSLSHKLLEEYANGELEFYELAPEFARRFPEEVTEYFPIMNWKSLRDGYYEKCLEYFNNFSGFSKEYEILGVEKKVEFEIDGYPFVGYIDLLLKNKNNGKITILDHKSTSVKFKKDGSPAKASVDKIKEFKRQLYLYSIPIIEEYGGVDKLCWNLFKDGRMYRVPWKKKEFEEAKEWAVNTIHEIENEEEWPSKQDFIYCCYLCSKRATCPEKWSKDGMING